MNKLYSAAFFFILNIMICNAAEIIPETYCITSGVKARILGEKINIGDKKLDIQYFKDKVPMVRFDYLVELQKQNEGFFKNPIPWIIKKKNRRQAVRALLMYKTFDDTTTQKLLSLAYSKYSWGSNSFHYTKAL